MFLRRLAHNPINFLRFKSEKPRELVKVLDYNMPYDSFEQINFAKSTLENYAKAKKVKIEISNPSCSDDGFYASHKDIDLDDAIMVKVTDLKSDKSTQGFVTVFDSEKSMVAVTSKKLMLDVRGEDIQQIVNVNSHQEFSFLRYLYKNIEDLVNNLQILDKK